MEGEAKKSNPGLNVRANVLVNLIRTLTMTVLSFLTYPYVTRALGDSVFGLYSWANAFVYYFLILAKISIPNLAIRECARVKDDKEKLSHLAQMFFLAQACTTVLSFALMVIVMAIVPELWENRGLIFLLSLNFLAGAFSFEWIYIALEKHYYISLRSITLLAVGAILTFLYINPSDTPSILKSEVYVYALITVSYTILTSFINCLLLPRYISFRKTAPYDYKPYLKPLLVLFLLSLALTLYNQTDEFLLGFLDKSKAEVGAYSVGVKGIEIIITIITSLYAVFLPRASYYYQKEKKAFFQRLVCYSFNITFFIAIPAIATMATMSMPITALISGSEDVASLEGNYADAAWILSSLSIMMLTYSLGDNVYNEILMPEKKEKYYLYAMLGGVVLNVGLSLLFALAILPSRKGLGVAIATGLTDLILAIYLLAISWHYSKKAFLNANNLKIVLAGIVVAVISVFLDPAFERLFASQGKLLWQQHLFALLLTVLVDAFVYIGGLLLARENLVSSFLPSRRKQREEEVHESESARK